MTRGLLPHLLRRALGDLLAVVEHGDLLRDAHDDLHVVLDEQDREPRSSRSWRMKSVSCADSGGFMPAVGSSSSSSFGSEASARAISTRRWSP